MLAGRSARPELDSSAAHGPVVVPGPVLTDASSVLAPVDVVFPRSRRHRQPRHASGCARSARPRPPCACCRNGIEQVDSVQPFVPLSAILPAVVWFPAVRDKDDSVRLLGPARLTLPAGPAAEVVADLLGGNQCSVELVADFSPRLAETPAERGRRPDGTHDAPLRRLPTAGRPDPGAPVPARRAPRRQSRGAELADDVPDQSCRFPNGPANHGTSIPHDREAGQPLEWDVRNGVMQRRGRALGVPTPISDVIGPLLAATSDGPG